MDQWLEHALLKVYVSEELVEEQLDLVRDWLGKQCNNCPEKKLKMTMLRCWARRVNDGKVDNADIYLEQMLGE